MESPFYNFPNNYIYPMWHRSSFYRFFNNILDERIGQVTSKDQVTDIPDLSVKYVLLLENTELARLYGALPSELL